MKVYYSLIRRSDFTDLFKYGQLYLNSLSCKEIKDEKGTINNNDILDSLFKKANCFESSFSYLVIQFQSSSFSNENPLVNIEDVTHIYPLDNEAKKEFETSFDSHIRIDEPIWANAYSKIQEYRTRKDCEKGAENLWKIFKVEESVEDCKEIISEDIIEEVVKELYKNRRPSGNLSLWVYLLRYERHAYYPQGVIGYFLDAVNIICNYISQKEVDEVAVNNTAIGEFLCSLPRDSKMSQILNALENSSESLNFITKISEIENRVKFLNVAVAYLISKNRFRDGIIYEPDYFKALAERPATSKYYGLILYLLGITLGHDKTYECLYENLPLPIFKNKAEMDQLRKLQELERMRAVEEMSRLEAEQHKQKKEKKQKENWLQKKTKSDIDYGGGQGQVPFRNESAETTKANFSGYSTTLTPYSSNEAINQMNSLFQQGESEDQYSIPQLPCLMGKLKKGSKTETCKTPKPVLVYTKEEYIKKRNSAWIEIANNK